MLNNIKDYLPLLNAIIITDLLFMIFLTLGIINSKVLKEWYSKYTIAAVIADVLVIMIVLLITNKIYNNIFKEFSIIKFILLALLIQIIHDILFYILISIIPRGKNKMIDTFKDYAKEISYFAIIGDSSMIIASGVIASYLANFDVNTNIILITLLVYILQFILHT